MARKMDLQKLRDLIIEEFGAFDECLPSPQDRALYRRRLIEYAKRVVERLDEGSGDDAGTGKAVSEAGEVSAETVLPVFSEKMENFDGGFEKRSRGGRKRGAD